MQMIRTILLVLIAIALTAFVSMNWHLTQVYIWPFGEQALYLEWPIGVVALFFFLLGMLPMWLLHKGAAWRLKRRIGNLENTLKANVGDTPTAYGTTGQLEATHPENPANPS